MVMNRLPPTMVVKFLTTSATQIHFSSRRMPFNKLVSIVCIYAFYRRSRIEQ